MKIFNAKIENNFPLCPICGAKFSGREEEYYAVRVEGIEEGLTLFKKHCGNQKCDAIGKYLLLMTLEENRRIEITEDMKVSKVE